MPARPPVANAISVRLVHAVGADLTAGSRFYLAYATAVLTPAQMTAFATAVEAAWVAHLQAMLSNEADLVQVVAQDLSSDTGAVGEWNGSSAGTRAGGPLPVGTCSLVSCLIARHYRGGKPRHYLPYGTDSDLAGASAWSGAFTTALGAAWAAFIAALVAYAGPPVISGEINVSYASGREPNPNPGNWARRSISTPRAIPFVDPISGYGVPTKIASQRRRTRV